MTKRETFKISFIRLNMLLPVEQKSASKMEGITTKLYS